MSTRYRNVWIGVGIAACTFALLAYSVLPNFGSKVFTVTLTETGFVPSRMLINKGDTVVFTSEIDREFWPASDSHPTHGRYPGFDPGRALVKGESWAFTFEKAGAWTFHDHLSSSVQGKILVLGAKGESSKNCLTVQTGTIQPECWEAEVLSLVREGGIASAFDSIRTWYRENPDFRRNCHDVMHVVGIAAYAEFTEEGLVTVRDEASYCGNGFYHGFVEKMLVEQGTGQYEDVSAYCAELKVTKPEAAGPCYHGIGHAVFDSIDGSLWGDDVAMVNFALNVCRATLPGEWERVRCGSGVFNALANAYSARTYGLAFLDNEPPSLCLKVPRVYRDFCNMELGNGYIRDKQWEKTREMDYLRGIENQEVRAAIIVGYMDTEVKRTIDTINVEAFAKLCRSFSTAQDIRACVAGVHSGLRGVGEPELE
ncbi:MAG: cupredoxin domain-containing protein, partial [Minisyncoccota bacterium]